MPVDDLLLVIRQLDGALHEGVQLQVPCESRGPVRAAGRGEKKRGERSHTVPQQGISSLKAASLSRPLAAL
jgi:hypothetical protein